MITLYTILPSFGPSHYCGSWSGSLSGIVMVLLIGFGAFHSTIHEGTELSILANFVIWGYLEAV